MASRVKYAIGSVTGALLGVAYCLLLLRLFNILELFPSFAAYGGDSDFSLRFTWFLLVVMPGFAAVGAWLGFEVVRDIRAGALALFGTMMGTVTYSVVILVFSDILEALPSRFANAGAISVELAWVAFSIMGGFVGLAIYRRRGERS